MYSHSEYDFVSNRPGLGSADSLPLGNGDVAANVWTERDGTLHVYLAKADAWDANGRLVKAGRLEFRVGAGGWSAEHPFEERLALETSEVRVKGVTDAGLTTLRAWVDAHAPVLHIEGESERPAELRLRKSAWRELSRTLSKGEAHGVDPWSGEARADGELLLDLGNNQLGWMLPGRAETVWGASLRQQGFADWAADGDDPLRLRGIGAAAEGEGFSRLDARTSVARGRRRWHLRIVVASERDLSEAAMAALLRERIAAARAADADESRRRHEAWWAEFWARSHIHARSPEWQGKCASEAYARQRHLLACAGRGAQPIKFNGSLFTADWGLPKEEFDADYRRWGGCYWLQNTRLIYWPMLAAGDYDMMRPFFAMYRDTLPLAEERVRRWWGHGGAWWPETMYFWGALRMADYGIERDGFAPNRIKNPYMANYWSPMLEVVALMLAYHAHTGDEAFLRETLLPVARGALRFYDEHFPRGAEGKLFIAHAHSIEQYHDCDQPLPDIAGLRHVTAELAVLWGLEERDRVLVARVAAAMPELPTREFEGARILAAAATLHGRPKNTENPELYAVFPFPLFGLGRPGLEEARLTWMKRRYQQTGGWRQDAIQAALLGLSEAAEGYVIANATAKVATARYPGFLGPFFDWAPDQCTGGVLMMAMQAMLLQHPPEGPLGKPAWPEDWSVSFALHGPRGKVWGGAGHG